MTPEQPAMLAMLQAQHMREVLKERAESLAQVGEEASAVETVGLLLFRLGEEWYAVGIDRVREILNEYEVTRIPRVPDFILGVINVRGEIVSVTDIATLMRVPSRTEVDLDGVLPSAVIVANESCVSAIVVDEIGDIVDVPVDSLEPPLSTLDKTQGEYIAGSVYIDARLIGIANLDKVLEPIGENG
ncbi:MAG: purine-binding chemotaxis protein CheW [Aeromicrobium sp.]|nr:purine-binding chemotaxis protein CheW [Aeromicrobium sp.]